MYVLVRYLCSDHTALGCLMSKFQLVSPLYLEGRSWLCLIVNRNSSAKFIPFFDGQTESYWKVPAQCWNTLSGRMSRWKGCVRIWPAHGQGLYPWKEKPCWRSQTGPRAAGS